MNQTNEMLMMQRQIAWMQAADKRKAFLKTLTDAGAMGSAYSNAVVEYDKENMQVF